MMMVMMMMMMMMMMMKYYATPQTISRKLTRITWKEMTMFLKTK
jgi:hypothetical protein